MDVFRKNIVLSILFFISALLMYYVNGPFSFENEKEGFHEVNYSEIELRGWQRNEIRTSSEVLDVLKADCTIFTTYSKPGVLPVTLYVGYYENLDKSKWSHAPQVCYTAQGWIMTTNDKVRITNGQEVMKVNRLRLEKGNEAILVYYWYQTAEKVFTDLYRLKLSLFLQRLMHKEKQTNGNAFVRISMPIAANPKYSHRQLEEFVDQFYPQFEKWLTEENSK